jgi:hypothetical protein
LKNRKILYGGIAAVVVIILVVIVVIVLNRPSAPEATEPTENPDAVFTEVMQTADALRFATGTAAAAQPSPTITATVTPTIGVTDTPVPVTPTLGPTAPLGALRMEYVADVTVPDGTVFEPNTTFTKTWRVRNGGTLPWNTAFSLVFASGDQLGGPASVPLTTDVPPGGVIDISITMVAPATGGRYISNWLMRSDNGQLFGVDPEAKFPIYTDITVSGSASPIAPTASPTAGAGVTPTATTASVISNVQLAVDNATASGCPHTYNFTASFNLSQAATVTYKLEAGVTDPNVIIVLPAPVTVSLEAGAHSVPYTLSFETAVEGWAQFHITAPADTLSNRVNYTLTCNP